MRKMKLIGSIASTWVALFLFLYSVSVFASSRNYLVNQDHSISKSGKIPVSPNAQGPFEENQGEETGDEFQNGASLVCLPEEALSLISIVDQSRFIHQASRPDKFTAHVPIYLATRSIII